MVVNILVWWRCSKNEFLYTYIWDVSFCGGYRLWLLALWHGAGVRRQEHRSIRTFVCAMMRIFYVAKSRMFVLGVVYVWVYAMRTEGIQVSIAGKCWVYALHKDDSSLITFFMRPTLLSVAQTKLCRLMLMAAFICSWAQVGFSFHYNLIKNIYHPEWWTISRDHQEIGRLKLM